MNLFLQIFPDGCSRQQLKRIHSMIFRKYGNPYFDKNTAWPEKIKRLEELRNSIEMLYSCYVYGQMNIWRSKYYEKYLKSYEEHGGAKDDFDRCITVQIKHMDMKMKIMHGIHTDSEGISYHGTCEADEVYHYEYL